jgi:Zn-dependent M32 family carboxypeptidase
MEDAMPEAVEVLLQNLRQKHDLKAALEVLDRDPQRQSAKGSRSGQSTNVGVGVQVRIDSQALAQAIDEANKTHEMIERATKSKPALTRQRF